jgi:hypothetical protein
MPSYIERQHSSRPIKYQVLAYTGNATSVPSTNFTSETYQIGISSEVQGWFVIGDGTAVSCTAQSSSMKIGANLDPTFWTVTAGQMCAFNSTSTSSGMFSIVELA